MSKLSCCHEDDRWSKYGDYAIIPEDFRNLSLARRLYSAEECMRKGSLHSATIRQRTHLRGTILLKG